MDCGLEKTGNEARVAVEPQICPATAPEVDITSTREVLPDLVEQPAEDVGPLAEELAAPDQEPEQDGREAARDVTMPALPEAATGQAAVTAAKELSTSSADTQGRVVVVAEGMAAHNCAEGEHEEEDQRGSPNEWTPAPEHALGACSEQAKNMVWQQLQILTCPAPLAEQPTARQGPRQRRAASVAADQTMSKFIAHTGRSIRVRTAAA